MKIDLLVMILRCVNIIIVFLSEIRSRISNNTQNQMVKYIQQSILIFNNLKVNVVEPH